MLTGKNAIVTGSTSGIGLAIAHALAEQGCNILLNGMGEKAAIDKEIGNFKEKYRGATIDYSPADMSKVEDIRGMVKQAESVLGGVDILVNNAGIQFTAPVEEFPEDKWDAIIAINLSASFHAIKAALPGMQKKNFGRIVNIASVHGLVASRSKSAYVAAKHGLVGLTKVVALENAERNITCNAICPGWVHTPLAQKQVEDKAKADGISVEEETKKFVGLQQPNNRFIPPEQIASLAVYLCDEAGSSFTGAALNIDGGWVAE
jgi:3-hydroxybutyrate dehydrogenase